MAGQEFEIPLKLADLEDGDGPFSLKELDERATSAPHELAKSELSPDSVLLGSMLLRIGTLQQGQSWL